ncbi:MAG: TraC family protein [Candidatus Daviesbacteria bacterium]|nr:TraC family protein [Candidatus Daviesbacteria bacterium]
MLFGKSKSKVSSRRQIRIKEVKDNILILPGNKYRSIIETSAINFELKSEDEQDAIIDNFQNFLNSLPCSLQILIRVREVDIDRYLEEFSKKESKEEESVYKNQIQNYCSFISDLVSGSKILSRRFYVVIPYDVPDNKHDFALIKEQLSLNQDIVIKGLEKLGMKTRILDSLEILELFYTFYNSDQIKSQPLRAESLKPIFEGSYAI